jgi:hypothetical protein
LAAQDVFLKDVIAGLTRNPVAFVESRWIPAQGRDDNE